MKNSTEKAREKKNKLPEVLILLGALGAVAMTATLNIIVAGYLLAALLIIAGLMLAVFGKR